MDIILESMSEAAYSAFYRMSFENHTAELMRKEGLSREDAEQETEKNCRKCFLMDCRQRTIICAVSDTGTKSLDISGFRLSSSKTGSRRFSAIL